MGFLSTAFCLLLFATLLHQIQIQFRHVLSINTDSSPSAVPKQTLFFKNMLSRMKTPEKS